MRNRLIPVLLALILMLIAAGLRCSAINKRPMHGDEANQAVKAGILFDRGVYAYDPHEHHGPTLYYAALPLFWLSGAKDFAATGETLYRLVPLIFGVALVGLTFFLARPLGLGAACWAALLLTVSHAMCFYSCYFVQEMLLVFFAGGALVSGYYWLRGQHLWGALLTGIFIGLMHATKETCLILYAAMIGASLGAAVLGRLRDTQPLSIPRVILKPAHLALFTASALFISVLLFSSFFTHARGPLDSILAFSTYLGRAEGTGSTGLHDKPWYYYLHLIAYTQRSAGPRWSEGLILLLAGIGLFPALLARRPKEDAETHPDPALLRFLALYTLLLLAAYSLIPYKTPWNMLVFFHPMILLAGVGAAAVIRWLRFLPLRAIALCLLLAGLGQLAHQSRLGMTLYAADARNPYVYAHTSTALMRLVKRVDEIAAFAPEGHAMQINIFKPDADYWPLPWYLRRFSRVGYFTSPPEILDAPFIIADPKLAPLLKEGLKDSYMQEYHALRPGVLLHTYIRQDLWDAFIASRS